MCFCEAYIYYCMGLIQWYSNSMGLTHYQKKKRAKRRRLQLKCTSRPARWWVWCQYPTLYETLTQQP